MLATWVWSAACVDKQAQDAAGMGRARGERIETGPTGLTLGTTLPGGYSWTMEKASSARQPITAELGLQSCWRRPRYIRVAHLPAQLPYLHHSQALELLANAANVWILSRFALERSSSVYGEALH
ncbi:MAG: hypothetical protein M1822_003010 [Bathelium mastoideum]|nr:MAG: hypothetical protein M1822_003010 [Bathelium mastoideum]